jgi:hypothetical protein
MQYEIRPLGLWPPDEITQKRQGSHVFKAGWDDTLKLLGRELDHLGARHVVIQLDVKEGAIRQDGLLRADAKIGNFPGVRISFQSRHGLLVYGTDEYEQQFRWALTGPEANLRAVALALQALRAVDRYGVTKHGQQYQGSRAITSQPAVMSRDQAAEFISHWTGEPDRFPAALLLTDPALLGRALRAAALRAHPDVPGGDHDTMARLTAARDVLTRGAR